MNEDNKKNARFLGVVFTALLVVLFTVIMLTYVGKAGLWSAPLPVAAIAYGTYAFVKRFLPREDKK